MQEILDQISQFWDQWWFLVEVLTLIALLLAAGAALITAYAAWRSAVASGRAVDETRVATTAQIMSSLLDEYSSDQMSDALTGLRQFVQSHGPEFQDNFRELLGKSVDAYRRLDSYRRRVSHFFDKIYRLQKAGYIDDAFVRTVVGPDAAEFYLEVIEPLDIFINPDYDDSAFKYFAKLHGVERRTK